MSQQCRQGHPSLIHQSPLHGLMEGDRSQQTHGQCWMEPQGFAGIGLVALAPGQIEMVLLWKQLSRISPRARAWVQIICLGDDHRHNGIGRVMLRGVNSVILGCCTHRSPSHL